MWVSCGKWGWTRYKIGVFRDFSGFGGECGVLGVFVGVGDVG